MMPKLYLVNIVAIIHLHLTDLSLLNLPEAILDKMTEDGETYFYSYYIIDHLSNE